MASSSEDFTLSAIIRTLSIVVAWFELGVQLEIPFHILRGIEKTFQKETIERQKTEMIYHWLNNNQDASWESLAAGLEKTQKYQNLVNDIRRQYCRSSE